MEEQKITFETAKLAFEKKFNWETDMGFTMSGKLEPPYYGNKFKNGDYNNSVLFSAPTQALLQKWLRDIHKMYISIDIEDKNQFMYYVLDFSDNNEYIQRESIYPTYEEALESALVHALTLIK